MARVGLVDVLLGLLDWRAGGRNGLCSQMKWNESEASIGRVLAVEVVVNLYCSFNLKICLAVDPITNLINRIEKSIVYEASLIILKTID